METNDLVRRALANLDPDLLSTTVGRKKLTALDPLAFALIYMKHHLTDTLGRLTLAPVHLDWCAQARKMIVAPSSPRRDAYIAPRNTGKSTWWFLILPMWAAAHGHVKFAAAFADSGGQAEVHLTTFKNELDNNKLLRGDFPDLCSPLRRENTGQTVADSRGLIVMKSGFTFAARGIDAANLGLKMNENRPDLLIFDDVEPDESSYSVYQAKKRLTTVQDAILPMNLYATVVFVGTVTMAGGIMHQFVNSVQSNLPPEPWIKEEQVDVHYYAPILTKPDGTEVSIWPEKWDINYLKSIQHTRSYAKNFRNLPLSMSGEYWNDEDFTINPHMQGITHTLISVDPAITTKKSSDFTGIANIAFKPGKRDGARVIEKPKCLVQDAIEVKLSGENLRKRVLRMIEESPTPVRRLIVEGNQGGDNWYTVFHDMPCPVEVLTNSAKKEVRASTLLTHYHRGTVEHRKPLPRLQDQMMGYPDVLHDDMIDAVGNGVSWYARRRKPPTAGAYNHSYL